MMPMPPRHAPFVVVYSPFGSVAAET